MGAFPQRPRPISLAQSGQQTARPLRRMAKYFATITDMSQSSAPIGSYLQPIYIVACVPSHAWDLIAATNDAIRLTTQLEQYGLRYHSHDKNKKTIKLRQLHAENNTPRKRT